MGQRTGRAGERGELRIGSLDTDGRFGHSALMTTSDGGDAQIDAQRVLDDVVDSLDQTWTQLDHRLSGLTEIEYLWEPVPGCWSVRDTGDGRAAVADWADPDPDPAPVTTIAWRMWHIAVDCLDSYSQRLFGSAGTGLTGTQWVVDVEQARALLSRAWRGFRDPIVEGGPGRLARALGPAWGPFSEHSTFALVLHAQREITHHAAEIALLRDLHLAKFRPDRHT